MRVKAWGQHLKVEAIKKQTGGCWSGGGSREGQHMGGRELSVATVSQH